MNAFTRLLLLTLFSLGVAASSPPTASALSEPIDLTADAPAYKVGDTVSVDWKGTWYKSTIIEAKDDKFKIHYEGWGAEWDEWVGTDRLRPFAGYQVGDMISVEWKGTWYKSKVVEIKGDKYKIHYDGWGAEWDEWVGTDRIRNLPK